MRGCSDKGGTEMKKVLAIGGTGAMGTYLVPKLVERGYKVDVIANDAVLPEDSANLTYRKADMYDTDTVREVLKNNYDGVVDFMIYDEKAISHYLPIYLDNADHYIYFSSYRVFADKEHPIVESSPLAADASDDLDYRYANDYAIYKAKGEKLLRGYGRNNWTIVRPAITYSKKRCQLMTLERQHILKYLDAGKPIPLCEAAKNVQGTMSWAGDVAEMLARLLFNPAALKEDFNVTTSEHHAWDEIAGYYKDIFGLDHVYVGEEEYLTVRDGGVNDWNKWQLRYDRMFDRIMGNSTVLKTTGMKQSDLTTLYDGLSREKKTILERP